MLIGDTTIAGSRKEGRKKRKKIQEVSSFLVFFANYYKKLPAQISVAVFYLITNYDICREFYDL